MDNKNLGCSIGKSYKKKDKEQFSWKKFNRGTFELLNPIAWAKDFTSIFNIRKLIIILLILSTIFGYGWYQGRLNTPVNVELGYGKEAYIRLDEGFLHIDKTGNVYIENKDGKILKQIKAKDIKGLEKELSPIGLQLKPIAIIGYGIGSGYYSESGVEYGLGISFARFWQARLDTFLTQRGVYLGASYKLDCINLKNSAIGIGGGMGWKGDQRILVYFRIRF